LPWVMGYLPHQELVSDDHVPAGPRPERLDPTHVLTRDGGDSRERGVGGRTVDATGSGLSGTSPRGPEKSGRDHRASVPRHVEGAVTAVVTAHGVKRFRPAGPGAARGPARPGPARGPARSWAGPPARLDNARRSSACNLPGSEQKNGWGRGDAAKHATGLENNREERSAANFSVAA
jgi:hypothetical protein